MKWWVRALVLLLGMVLVALLVWLVNRGDGMHTKTVVFSDGTVLEYLGVVQGGTPFTTEKPWHATLRRYLSPSLLGWLPAAHTLSCGSTNELSVYFRLSNIPDGNNSGRGENLSRVRAVDEVGYEFEATSGRCTGALPDREKLLSLNLRQYPRRQTEFSLDLLDADGGELTTLTVANPLKTTFPMWTASPLPATNVVDGVRVVLNGFESRGNRFGQYWLPQLIIESVEGTRVPLTFRSHQFVDPTGNSGSHLSPLEKVWKSRVKIMRPRNGPFPADTVGRFELTSVPADGEVHELGQVIEVKGIKLRAYFFAGAGRVMLRNGVELSASLPDRQLGSRHSISSSSSGTEETWESGKPFLLVETEDLGSETEILFRLRDDEGQLLETIHPGGYSGGGSRILPPFRRIYRLTFERSILPEDVQLECVINRGMWFEFLVNSEELLAESLSVSP